MFTIHLGSAKQVLQVEELSALVAVSLFTWNLEIFYG